MEKFEKEGRWWLPHSCADELPGLLSFDPQNGGMLETIGRFKIDSPSGHHDLFDKVELIHGYVRGSAYTLVHCQAKDYGETYSPDFESFRYSVQNIYAGHHFKRCEDIQFREVTVGFTHLDYWVGHDKLQHGLSDHGHYTPLTGQLEIPSAKCNIKIDHQHKVERKTRTSTETQDVSRIIIKFSVKEPFSKYRPLIETHIPGFLTLATLNANFPFDILGRVENNIGLIGIHYRIPRYDEKQHSDGWMNTLFRFDDVKENLADYLDNWISKYEYLWAVYDLYFQTIYNQSLNVRTSFLLLAQALEAYHRHCGAYQGVYMTKEDYEPKSLELQHAIPDSIDYAHRKSLEARIRFGYQHALRRRLGEIYSTISAEHDVIMKALFGKKKDFVTAVNDTRNLLTHHDQDETSKPLSEEYLPGYLQRLQGLLQVIFLTELGMDSKKLQSVVGQEFCFKVWLHQYEQLQASADE